MAISLTSWQDSAVNDGSVEVNIEMDSENNDIEETELSLINVREKFTENWIWIDFRDSQYDPTE